jgi:hypothetical protein
MSRPVKLLILVMLVALPVAAADNGFYIGGAATYSDVSTGDLTAFELEDKSNGYKIFGGARFLHFLGAEAQYNDFGSIEDRNAGAEADIDGFGAAVVGYIPLVFLDIFGKAGIFNSNVDITNPGINPLNTSTDSTDPYYGVGVQFRIKSWAIRAEGELYDVEGVDKLYSYSLGASYTF